MTSKVFPNLPASSNPSRVLVDVYAWLGACDRFKRVVMEGIFRHAEAFCKIYTPAVFADSDDKLTSPGSLPMRLLSQYLGKEIRVFRSIAEIVRNDTSVWLSLAVDFPCPLLAHTTPFVKAAILHDTLAGEGFFGSNKEEQYLFGARNNELFLYVSQASLERFVKYAQSRRLSGKSYLAYSCFHSFSKLPRKSGRRSSTMALAVHSIYARKNLPRELELSRMMGLELSHVGQCYYSEQSSLAGVKYLGPVSDEVLVSLYQKASTFICMSSNEGFSIPPLEAIILGVPYVYLSDIDVHRENYDGSGAQFVSPNVEVDLSDCLFSSADNGSIFSSAPETWFNRFSAASVLSPVVRWLDRI